MVLYRWLSEVVAARGSAKALVYRDTYVAWRGILQRVDRRAQELASFGIGEGAWVGLMLGNVPDFIYLALALSKLKAVVVPIDPTTAARELDLVLDTAPLRALITRPRGTEPPGTTMPPPASPARRSAATARGASPAPVAVGRKVDVTETRRRLQGTLLTCSIFKREPLDLGLRPELVLLTSDSSGDPKGALRTESNLVAITDTVGRALDIGGNERLLVATPVFHAYGMDLGLLTMLRRGLTLYLEEEVSPSRLVKILREQEIDLLPGTPDLYATLAKLPTARPLKASQVKSARFLSGGAPLRENVAEAFRTRYGVRLLSCYHTTETGLVALDRRGQSPESVGKAVEGVEVRLGLVTGAKGTVSGEGPVWVRSGQVAPRTIGPYAVPRPRGEEIPVGGRDAGGYYRTGDTARIDKSGKIVLTGREDDLVKVDGKRVALGEVEGCLESFPKVKQAQALVVTDPLAGPMVIAKVVPAGTCQAEEIIDHCARNLAPYKVPRRIEFCDSLG